MRHLRQTAKASTASEKNTTNAQRSSSFIVCSVELVSDDQPKSSFPKPLPCSSIPESKRPSALAGANEGTARTESSHQQRPLL